MMQDRVQVGSARRAGGHLDGRCPADPRDIPDSLDIDSNNLILLAESSCATRTC
jgi:hypothetical protein